MIRDFDLGDILSVTDGALVSTRHMDGVYDLLGFMTGGPITTIGLMWASTPCAKALLEQHPDLVNVRTPEWDRSGDVKFQVEAWLASVKIKYGETLPVVPLTNWKSS